MIKYYDSVFTPKQCKDLIKIFDKNKEAHQAINTPLMKFNQYNFTSNEMTTPLHQEMVEGFMSLGRKYFSDVEARILPNIGGFEEVRIKKYVEGGDFIEQIDVMNYASSRRIVGFLLYLNDCDGITTFANHDITIEPKTGRVLVFPPTWEYPHAGHKSSTDKYIMSTYLHLAD